MSMIVSLVKVTPSLHQEIVESGGALLTGLLMGIDQHSSFDKERDCWNDIDRRDLAVSVGEEEHPVLTLFDGEPLLEGYEWTYGPPCYFDPDETAGLVELLMDDADIWPVSDILRFIGNAALEGKGLIAGTA